MFYSKQLNGFCCHEVNGNLPADAVELTDQQYKELLIGQSLGKSIVADENGFPVLVVKTIPIELQKEVETQWRNNELLRCDAEINKHADKDEKAIGTIKQWREYRKALRSWPEHEHFPNKEFRPKAPDYKE